MALPKDCGSWVRGPQPSIPCALCIKPQHKVHHSSFCCRGQKYFMGEKGQVFSKELKRGNSTAVMGRVLVSSYSQIKYVIALILLKCWNCGMISNLTMCIYVEWISEVCPNFYLKKVKHINSIVWQFQWPSL